MNADRWAKFQDAFHRLVDCPVAERPQMLQLVCGDDAELRGELEAMLASDTVGEERLRQAIGGAVVHAVEGQRNRHIGTVLGAYRIIGVLETIGFQLWDDALDERERDGSHTLIAGLREFREHLGGELHITLLRGIGKSFEVTEMDETLILEAIDDLSKLRPTFAKVSAG